ncbi:MAG TPA: MarR family transcriptional regulator [Longimicrobiales bacterium]
MRPPRRRTTATQHADARIVAWRLFMECAGSFIALIDAAVQEAAQLSIHEFDVLLNLDDAGGSLRMGELAAAITFSKSGLTRLVDRLVAAGLVEREAVPEDRRALAVVLTTAGSARLRAARAADKRVVYDLWMANLTAKDGAALASAFKKVHAAVRP